MNTLDLIPVLKQNVLGLQDIMCLDYFYTLGFGLIEQIKSNVLDINSIHMWAVSIFPTNSCQEGK